MTPSTKVSPRLVFLGPPGVGKGTFGSRLSKRFGIPHISTGDIIRAEIKSQSVYGKEFQGYANKGLLVPDQLVVDMAFNRISQPDCSRGYLLDGFPRTLTQADALELHSDAPNLAVNISLPEEILTRKLLGRRMCGKCGGNFNVETINEVMGGVHIKMPPLLPTQEQLSSCPGGCPLGTVKLEEGFAPAEIVADAFPMRADDTVSVIKDRLAIYKEETAPIENFYEEKGRLINFIVREGVTDAPALEAMIRCTLG